MSLRVVLTGSECTGKTTLAAKLADHYKVTFIPEYLRSYFEQKNGLLTPDDVIPIARGQLELEAQAQARGDDPVICDTDIISSIVYAKHYFGICPDWLEEQFRLRTPSLYLLCDMDIEWTADGQRDMGHEREYMQQLFVSELESRGLAVHRISGTAAQRLNKAVLSINQAMSLAQSRSCFSSSRSGLFRS
ncbi:AAA family ATPase [Maridesulfovibrio sp. FT414]|uniref:AAA family ATPase n=1 Tax=Maridesulfovibrio sp. FT414 TaxID=2979469 RepID=UPI003D803B4D